MDLTAGDEKKRIWLWSLYDFANSLAFINVSFYFVLWFVSDLKGSSIWVSIPVALSTIVLFFTLPALGAFSDKIRRRMPFLIVFSLCAIVSLFLLGFLAVKTNALSQPVLIGIVILYFLFQYFYQAALAFYNPFIDDLSVGKTKEFISGIGMAAGQVGNIIGLLLVFPIAQGKFSFLGLSGRSSTFLVGAILFLIFSLPVFIFLKDRSSKTEVGFEKQKLGKSFKETLKDLKNIRQYPGVLSYLISYYLFSDAILTLQLFASLYLEKVGGLADKQKTIAFCFFSERLKTIIKSTANHALYKMFFQMS